MERSANTFVPFLQTMNIGKSGAPSFDLEASAKSVLQLLSSNQHAMTREAIGSAIGLTPDQTRDVIAHLVDAGMIVAPEGDKVNLSDFGRDALGVFSVVS